jgi:hypothetical protein
LLLPSRAEAAVRLVHVLPLGLDESLCDRDPDSAAGKREAMGVEADPDGLDDRLRAWIDT